MDTKTVLSKTVRANPRRLNKPRGVLTLRMKTQTHERITKLAYKMNVSQNTLINILIEDAMKDMK